MHRKKSLQKSLTLNSVVDAAIYNKEDNTLNGIPISDIETRLSSDPKLPEGMRGACLICSPIVYFKTMDACIEHTRKKHMSWTH